MPAAFFVQPPDLLVKPADGEVTIAMLDNLAADGAYVILAKAVAATVAGPDKGVEALRVQFLLAFAGATDYSWCYLVKGPGQPDPVDTVSLNLGAVVPLGTRDPRTGPMSLKGSAQFSCRSSNGEIEVTHIAMTAIEVDAIRPPSW